MKQVLYKTLIFITLLVVILPISATFANASSISAEIVIEQSTGRILHEKNSEIKLPMASTTKIMTALVAIENTDPDDLVIIPREAQGVEGSSIYLKAGDSYTVKDLLYGLMLRSGNDSATALAIHISGSMENFIKLMNDRAKSLGALNTNFVNSHGLHDDDHYTTAKDLALITKEAYDNPLFRKIASSKSYNLKGSLIYNKNKLLSSYEGADGVKTGYTKAAGRCLVSSSTRNGMQVICVVLNCYDMWERSKSLMNNAHSEYAMRKVLSHDTFVDAPIEGGVSDTVKASPASDRFYPLTKHEADKITVKTNVLSLIAPIPKGEYCGFSEVYLDNRLIFKENIYTIESVKKKSFFDWITG